MDRKTGFLLTREWRDRADGHRQIYWLSTDDKPLKVVVDNQQPVCFMAMKNEFAPKYAERKRLQLVSADGEPVDALYFKQYRQLRNWRRSASEQGVSLFESDIKPCDRFLMERFITAPLEVSGRFHDRGQHWEVTDARLRVVDYTPQLSWASLDIETSDIEGELYSIAVLNESEERVFMRGTGVDESTLSFHVDEQSLIQAFLVWFEKRDPDLIIGWHVTNFDLDFLFRKSRELGLLFSIGRGGEAATVLPGQNDNRPSVARIPGRVVLDGIECLRSAFITFEDWSLQSVSRKLLGSSKLISDDAGKVEEIRRLFHDDKKRLAAYNLQDCRLVAGIFGQCKLIDFAIERAKLTGLPLGRFGGSVAAFDNLYLPRLHRKGMVAPDLKPDTESPASPGGYVLDSSPGIYTNVAVLDFKSLYPGIIRTFKVDPYGLTCPGTNPVPGFLGAEFARDDNILPALIGELWQARDEAKRHENASLSQAIKIIMNSFYGVLGSSGCRFFDPRLASSITKRGHEIMTRSRDYIESRGYQVIYGDTDSLFVWLKNIDDEARCLQLGQMLQQQLNRWWDERLKAEYQVQSFLEIEFETLYLHFLMPRIRGLEKGSKKRYAGMIRRNDGSTECLFKGLESVRSDWTYLARHVQRELYERIFRQQAYKDYLQDIRAKLYCGALDNQLVYRKRLRRPLAEYQKNIPPHVQAAYKLEKVGRYVEYVITVNGPEPVQAQKSLLDYQHYEEKQLQPVVDGILVFLDESYENICGAQIDLFA